MATKNVETLVLVGKGNGIVIIPSKSPLKRLNYFDGKFLRASDLKDEQNYLRQLVRLSNQAGGAGAVHGFDLTLGGGDTLNLGPGLGIDRDGRVLLLPQEVSMGVQELIDLSLAVHSKDKNGGKEGSDVFGDCVMISDPPSVNGAHPSDLYLIVLFPAEALCGQEDVYGKLCEEACATSTDRPFAVEGLIVRALPLVLQTALPQSKIVPITSKLYLRSRVASAYFEDERLRVASMISRFGLAQQVWCLGAEATSGAGLPIGVIARAGATTVFLDAWIARRERMDTPPRRYWQWRMMMRPWDVFLAQILHFQCQLRDVFKGEATPTQDPCGDARSVLGEAAKKLADFLQSHKELSTDAAFKDLEFMSQKLTATEQQIPVVPVGKRLLIQAGIIELPSAGYLPVLPNGNVSVDEQVRQMMGEGVDLRFCVVRPDFVAHALEEAQHMERISLIQGLEDPQKMPQVDILIPDGEFVGVTPATLPGFAAATKLQAKAEHIDASSGQSQTFNLPDVSFTGVARAETLSSGGQAFYLGSSSPALASVFGVGLDLANWPKLQTTPGNVPSIGLWLELNADRNLLQLKSGDTANIHGEILVSSSNKGVPQLEFHGEINGLFTADAPKPNFPVAGDVDLKFSFEGPAFPKPSGNKQVPLFARQQGSVIQIQLAGARVQLLLEADLSNPANVTAKLVSLMTPDPQTAFTIGLASTLNRDDDVFSTTNNNHVLAVQGLGFIAAAISDSAFVNKKSALLFPPKSAEQSGGAINARRDWVLFHRRRNKNCGAVAALADRRYRVFQLAFTPDFIKERNASADDLFPKTPPTKEELLQLTAKDVESLKPLGEVTFGAGVATLVGDSSAVKSGWQKIPGGMIVWGAIGSAGEAVNDGDTLARTRLQALESVLDQVSPSARADVLPIVPPVLASANVDGVIVIVNAAPMSVESANLRIKKTSLAGKDPTGAPIINFTLEVANDGPSTAKDVKVTDPIPPETTFISGNAASGWMMNAPASGATGDVVFTKASVGLNETAVFNFAVRVDPHFSGGIPNVATVSSSTPDPDTKNNSATTLTTISPTLPPPPPPPPPIKTTCLTVFTVNAVGELDLVTSEFNRGLNPLARLLPPIGDINFQEKTTTVPDSSLVTTRTNYVKRDIGAVAGALLLMRKDTPPADADNFRKQVAAIRAQFPIALGTQPPLKELQLTNLPAEIKCQAGLILAGEVAR